MPDLYVPNPPTSALAPSLAGLVADLDAAAPADLPATAFALGLDRHAWRVHETRPAADLVGWSAPRRCRALAVVATGASLRAVPWSDLSTEPAGDEEDGDGGAHAALPGLLRLVVAVTRSGTVAGRLSVDGDRHVGPPAGGRMLDVLERCLGLPTTPPPEDITGVLAVLWLASVIEQSEHSPTRLGWSQVLDLHPAIQLVVASRRPLSRRQVTAIVDGAPRVWTWEMWRILAEAGRGPLRDLCEPALATWMDAGAYARWVLSELPRPEAIMGRALAAVTPDARGRLAERLSRLSGPCRPRFDPGGSAGAVCDPADAVLGGGFGGPDRSPL